MNSERGALLAMASGACLIGLTGILVQFADVPPTVAGMYRMLFGGLMLLALLLLFGRWRSLSPRAWWFCLWPGVAFAADLWLWHRSIHAIGPGLATLLANTQVFFMVVAGTLLFGERLHGRFLIGVLLAFGGLVLILGQGWVELSAETRAGVWFGLATGLAYATYNLGLRRSQIEAGVGRAEPVLVVSSLICGLLLALAAWAEGVAFAIPDTGSLLALLAMGLIGQCLGWVLIGRALPRLRVATVGLLLLLQPLVAFVLDVLLFERATSLREWSGVALTLAGIFLAGLRPSSGVRIEQTGGQAGQFAGQDREKTGTG